AIAVGRAALADEEWRRAAADWTASTAARLDALMTGAGFSVEGGCRLFRLYACKDAAAWFERLARAGILTRPFAWRPDILRLGLLAGDADFDRLAAALS
ncbi:MAG: threonine-phosphate decarboxylase, partial [Zavarzinia sp.]